MKSQVKQQFKRWKMKIQNDLNNYSLLETEIREKEEDRIGIGAQVIDDMPKGNHAECNSQTENQAINLINDLESLRKTKLDIDRAVEKLHSDLQDYFHMRYEKEYSRHKTARELYLSYAGYDRTNRKIILAVGKEMGLIE